MAASMLTGERRWMSARRGGMTVLGKVPKPVNLPSQRLENHGLDPAVEIVPKGTIGWGSRPSAPNAWGATPSSPSNTDRGAGSPSRLNDRPSSGGSGTRPSTAGSERSNERLLTVWGPSSRPSSASGVLSSNQTSITLSRPRSAETRPGSSQLSRFAESVSENSVAWGTSGTLEKLGASKNDGFSLSSGDFPTLGSEKSDEAHMRQGHSSQGRPVSSASSRAATPKERAGTFPAEDESIDSSPHARTSRKDCPPDFGVPPHTDKWQRESQPYNDPNMPPQYFGPWRGAAPHNTPNGVWYGGPSGALPYAPSGPPGSYPLEPFYYHHRLPARPLTNLQPMPRPGSGHTGYHPNHPNSGDSFRPHMPDSYVQPVMPVGSGVYPVQVPYDGYYGPPRGAFCNPNERDAPIMGMHAGPAVYNRYPIQNVHPDPGNFHGCGGPTSTAPAKEQGGSANFNATHHHQGPYKVLLKHHDSRDVTDAQEKEHAGDMPGTPKEEHMVNTPHPGKGNTEGKFMRESDSGDNKNEEPVGFSQPVSRGGAPLPSGIQGGHSLGPVETSSFESGRKPQRADENFVKKPQMASVSGEAPQQVTSTKRNPTLMEKIHSLNNKARSPDVRHDVVHAPTRDEKLKAFKVPSARSDHTSVHAVVPAIEVTASAGDKSLETLASERTGVSRPVRESQASAVSSGGGSMNKRPQGMQGRADHRGKGKVGPQDAEEWRKKSFVTDTSSVVSLKQAETGEEALKIHPAQDEKSSLSIPNKAGEEVYETSNFDPNDQKLQRTMMREIAAERARQLQKEEEERQREQKARALAKLEELNRRTQAETSTEKLDDALLPCEASIHKKEDALLDAAVRDDAQSNCGVPISASGWESDTDRHVKVPVGQTESKIVPVEASLCPPQDPIVTHLSVPVPVADDITDVTDPKTTEFHPSSGSKSKQVSNKRKQNMNKNQSDRPIPSGNTRNLKSHANVASNLNASSGESNLSRDTNITDDPLMQNKRRNNKGKNKHKNDEVSAVPALPSLVVEEFSANALAESGQQKPTESVLGVASDKTSRLGESAAAQDSAPVVPSKDKELTSPSEARVGVNSQSKPQLSRRPQRGAQATRQKEKFHSNDAVVWAPVRSVNKNEVADEVGQETTVEVSSGTGSGTHNNPKRRAEMERYVPKPVAKEQSQYGNAQQLQPPSAQSISKEPTGRADMLRYVPKQVSKEHFYQGTNQYSPSPSVNQPVSDEKAGGVESSSPTREISETDSSGGGKGGLAVVTRTGDGKHHKSGKAHGLWRQRNSSQSTPVQSSLEGSSNTSDQNKATSKSIEQHHSLEPEYTRKEKTKDHDNLNAPNNSVSVEPVSGTVVTRDLGVTSRGRKHPFKAYKSTGHTNNSDNKDLHGNGDPEVTQSSSLGMNQTDGKIALRENLVGEPPSSSHWQPKSQSYVSHAHQGSRANEGHRATSQAGRASKMEYHSRSENSPTQGGVTPGLSDKDETDSRRTVVVGVQNVRHQETKRDKKRIESSKEGAHLRDEYPDNITKPSLTENVDNQYELSSSGQHRDGHHHNGRFGRGHETSRGGRNLGRQDYSKQRFPPASSDRWQNESHNNYQPTRSYNNKPSEFSEEGSRATGSKFRERGRTHSRRGGENYYGRGE